MKHEHRPTDINLLKAKLTKQNYKEKFHQLLCREEEEHDRILIERLVVSIRNCTLHYNHILSQV